jgi:hypothetical protein
MNKKLPNCGLHRFRNPKELYLYAKNVLKTRYEEAEHKIVRPYNYKLKKFVSKPEEYSVNMFLYAIAYLRNILVDKSPKIIVDQYREKLEQQLKKFFDPHSVLNYATVFREKLPDEMHNRLMMECMMDNDEYDIFANYIARCVEKPKEKHKGSHLSRNQIVHNLLIDNPNLDFSKLLNELKKIGILVSTTEAKRLITVIKKST